MGCRRPHGSRGTGEDGPRCMRVELVDEDGDFWSRVKGEHDDYEHVGVVAGPLRGIPKLLWVFRELNKMNANLSYYPSLPPVVARLHSSYIERMISREYTWLVKHLLETLNIQNEITGGSDLLVRRR